MAIYGRLNDVARQAGYKEGIREGLDYLKQLDSRLLCGKPVGYSVKTDIKGSALFALHQVYETKSIRQARYEGHRAYIDLQYVWAGKEWIAITSPEKLVPVQRYDAKKDIEFFRYFPSTSLLMAPGVLAVLFPSDLHAPGLDFKKGGIVRKTVVKVRI